MKESAVFIPWWGTRNETLLGIFLRAGIQRPVLHADADFSDNIPVYISSKSSSQTGRVKPYKNNLFLYSAVHDKVENNLETA